MDISGSAQAKALKNWLDWYSYFSNTKTFWVVLPPQVWELSLEQGDYVCEL